LEISKRLIVSLFIGPFGVFVLSNDPTVDLIGDSARRQNGVPVSINLRFSLTLNRCGRFTFRGWDIGRRVATRLYAGRFTLRVLGA
jgi:hypothetical protein